MNIKHKMSHLREYVIWKSMLQRCNNPKNSRYHDYGGRGIVVHKEWESFDKFIHDVGFSPTPEHTLDRFPNNDGNYEPGNIRWATTKEQAANKRNCGSIEYNGIKRTKSQLAKIVGISLEAFIWREKNNWSLDKIMTTPKRSQLSTKKITK